MSAVRAERPALQQTLPAGGRKAREAFWFLWKKLKWLEDMRHLSSCWKKPFPVIGQGTFIFNADRRFQPFYISVEDAEDEYPMIALHVGNDCASFIIQRKRDRCPKELKRIDQAGCGVEEGKVSYWYSYDRDNLVLKYGKGYRMEETTLMTHDFLAKAKNPRERERMRQEMHEHLFRPDRKKFVKLYNEMVRGQFECPNSQVEGVDVLEPLVEFDKEPFICNLPPMVLDSSKVNLFTLDKGDYTFSASLPSACKELYSNVVGCDLNYTEVEGEKVLLSDAIRYSLANGVLKEKIESKVGELGDDPNETYLRVTLGHSLGKSPGIPYVLEIWPAGHYSPIHNHGNANAVIKVLFGSITIDIFNKQSPTSSHDPLLTFEASAGNVTWLDRNWYQTHKLRNPSNDYCATIQCYKYDAGDTAHWPYFDYVSEHETIDEFYPNSDFDFCEMREKVMTEYKHYIFNYF
ncbi:uncharacterized protein LOC110987493 [Acanthaster planci]|uniref:Uncharacterized protein LOC110987493 n=1 Tax=Acanthaster planci TaxID=133434 RepID=A0A8B7ZKB9_ACAPL|nr:uncharacterized protein LOC110987493 [Acanthaster planci]XP_022105950.1 uncharacterized protein LOC110987493 [Acanthaster planci]